MGLRGPQMRPVWERIDGLISPEPNSGCWLWMGAVSSHGYGQIRVLESGEWKTKRVHKVNYERYKGPVPDGKVLRHHCDVLICVNPDHMTPGTQKENIRDSIVRGRWGTNRARDESGKFAGTGRLTC